MQLQHTFLVLVIIYSLLISNYYCVKYADNNVIGLTSQKLMSDHFIVGVPLVTKENEVHLPHRYQSLTSLVRSRWTRCVRPTNINFKLWWRTLSSDVSASASHWSQQNHISEIKYVGLFKHFQALFTFFSQINKVRWN